MKIIGITGSSGSGKSLVAKIITDELDAKLIVADEVVKTMQLPGEEYYKEIAELFGKDFLSEDGKLNRKKIAQLIFTNMEKRIRINEITEKYVVKEIKRQIDNSSKNYVVLDVPLLVESGLNKICDYTIAVVSNKDAQIERICLRDKITKEEAILRLKVQPDNVFYKNNTDFTIINEGKKDDKFMGRIREILHKLQQM